MTAEFVDVSMESPVNQTQVRELNSVHSTSFPSGLLTNMDVFSLHFFIVGFM